MLGLLVLMMAAFPATSSTAQQNGQQLQQQQLQQQQQKQRLAPELDFDNTPRVFESDVPYSGADERIENQLSSIPAAVLKAQTPTRNQTFIPQQIIQSPPPTRILSTPPSPQPVPDTYALTRGCKPGVFSRVNPQWVSVSPSDPPVVVEGTVSLSKVTYEDFPFNHKSHDHNFDVIVDPKYMGFVGTANDKINGQPRIMEMEWEIGTRNTGITDRFPKEFWPMEGDRVWMQGRWIFDCGHYSADLTNPRNPRYYGFNTEVHPPSAVAFTRLEPILFPGYRQAQIFPAAVTHIYIHGQGGYYNTPVGGRNYEFDIPMPQKPSSILPTTQLRYVVLGLPFGGPAPIVTPKPQENKAHVAIPLSGIAASPNLKYGAIVASTWTDQRFRPISTEGYRTLKVTFDSIQVYNDHDPFGSGSGEWYNLWVGVNGRWIELSGPSGHYGLNDVDDGDVKVFNLGATGGPEGGRKSVTLMVPEKGALKIRTTGWERDAVDDYFGRSVSLKPSLLNNNDRIGLLSKDFSAANNFGIGSHADFSARNVDSDTNRDFNLRYRIEQVSITPPTNQPSSQLPSAPTKPPVLP
jgi:hypothetical protein